MQIKLKTLTLALMIATYGVVNARPASAITRAECIARAQQSVDEAYQLSNRRGMSYGGAMTSVVGLGLISAALIEGSYSQLTRNSNRFASQLSVSGTALAALGIVVFLDAAAQQRRIMDDELRSFRQTEGYQCLVIDLGPDRAEEFVADLLAEWGRYQLARKYLSPDEFLEFQRHMENLP